MQVVSVSRRTDVPAFYADWFRARWRAGRVAYRNPYGGARFEVSLRPEDVLGFVFWSRNYRPFHPLLVEIERAGVPFDCHFTITGLPRLLESGVPPLERAVETVRRLAGRFGPGRLVWRYDPVVLSTVSGPGFHRGRFERLCRDLEGATSRCVLSFVAPYRKVLRNTGALAGRAGVRWLPSSEEERRSLTRDLAAIAASRGISVEACCSDDLLDADGGGRDEARVKKSRCVDADRFRGFGEERDDAARRIARQPTREGCGCSASRDVGAYDTCPHGCVYCYANASPEAARKKFRTLKALPAGRAELAPPERSAAAPPP